MSSIQDLVQYPTATFQYQHRPVVPVEVQDARGGWQTVYMLSDSGNDITILNKQTASQLGFEGTGTAVGVKGIGDSIQQSMRKENVFIKIGDTQPIPVTILIMDTDMNLLGRKDVFENFNVTFSQGNVIFEQHCQFCGSGVT